MKTLILAITLLISGATNAFSPTESAKLFNSTFNSKEKALLFMAMDVLTCSTAYSRRFENTQHENAANNTANVWLSTLDYFQAEMEPLFLRVENLPEEEDDLPRVTQEEFNIAMDNAILRKSFIDLCGDIMPKSNKEARKMLKRYTKITKKIGPHPAENNKVLKNMNMPFFNLLQDVTKQFEDAGIDVTGLGTK